MQENSDLTEKLIVKEAQEGVEPENIDMSKIFNNEYNTSEHGSEKFFKEHLKNVEYVGQLFRTDFEHGLSSSNKQDLEWRERKWGNNHLPPEKENSILEHIINCFEDPTLRVLLVASIISLIIGVAKDGLKTGWIEGTAIFFAVFLVVSISSYMNYQEMEQFLKLSRENKLKKVLVIRDGMEKEISIEDILVGDILKLRIGDIINVDGFVFGDAKVGMDESPVTGESEIMWKVNNFESKGQRYSCPFVFSGSQVVDGYGNMVVAAVGDKTFEGQNKQLLNSSGKKKKEGEEGDDDDEGGDDANLTPLKKQLNDLSNLIGDLGYLFAILIGCVLFLKEMIINLINGISIFTMYTIDVLVNAFIIAVTVIVVAIPEGLPMAVTIAFAFSVNKMKIEHNLVKHLDKSEAMGNVNNVCTDKTGTLTLGVMRIAAFFVEDEDIRLNKAKVQDENLRDLIWNCIYKNITCVETTNEKGEKVLNGDMTEKALFTYLKENNYPLEGNRKGVYVLPFKSEYKYMMNIFKGEKGYILYAKGAPERVSPFFSLYRTKGDQEENFEEHAEDLARKQAEYAEDSMRTLIFGYKKLTEEEKGYFYARPVHADVLVEFDSSTGTFSLSGHMLLNENYRLTTAQSNETYGSYSPRPCERDAQQNTIKCTMSNPDEFKEHGSAANVAVTFGVLGDQEIFLKDFEIPEYLRTDEYRDYVNIMKGVILGAESEQELIHNTFISEKLDFTLSDALLNIYWKGLPAKVRTDIKSEQIKWIKDKESSCGKINPKSSEKEQAQVYKCQRLTTEKRTRYLSDLQ